MGINADAELIWGIPVWAYDEETGDPTEFWDEENEDWRELEGELKIHHYGHYEDPDNKQGILTSTRVKPLMADCWEPVMVPTVELANLINNDKLYSKSSDQARASGLKVNFYTDARWWLVASYG